MSTWLLWGGLFLLVALVVQTRLYSWQRQVETDHFLARVGVAHTLEASLQQEEACRWCRLVAVLMPINARNREKLQLALWRAGFMQPSALYGFLWLKLGVLLLGVIVGFGLWQAGHPFFVMPLLAVAGALLPDRWLELQGARRRSQIEVVLPDFLDMVSIGMRAGLNWMAAFQRVTSEFSDIHPPLAQVFDQMLRQIQLGLPRTRALEQLAFRLGSEDMRQLTQMLVENEKLGAPIADSLEAFTKRLYARREQRLEERAAKLSAKMSIIILIFMMVPYFIILLGERFVELSRSF